MKKKWLWIIPVLMLSIIFGILVSCHNTAYMVFRNWITPTYQIDDGQDWDGGAEYLSVPYANVSPSDYVDIYVPNGENLPPLYVIIHGGGFVSGNANSKQSQLMYRYFRDHGFACASVNYRLAQEAPFPAAVEDCKAAIRFLRAHAEVYGYDADKITVFGESAGGYLAVMCATTNDTEFNDLPFIGQDKLGDVSAKVNVLVDYYGHIDWLGLEDDLQAIKLPKLVYQIANSWIDRDVLEGYKDPTSFWLRQSVSKMTAEELAVSNPYTYIEENLTPDSDLRVWIVHGDCDLTVPYLHSERLNDQLIRQLGSGRVSYRLIPNMGHASDPLYSDKELELLEAYLTQKTLRSQFP